MGTGPNKQPKGFTPKMFLKYKCWIQGCQKHIFDTIRKI
jgi:hypothetical protein